MAVGIETVRDLFENKQWSVCAEQASLALAGGENGKPEKALLNLYRSNSLRRLKQFTEALEPGRLALYMADELGDQELIGRALTNLAWILHKIPGMEPSAVEAQQRFLTEFPRFTTLRNEYLGAMLNMGVYLRAAGEYEEAYQQFKTTWNAARQRGDQQVAQLSRTYAVWEALRLGRLAEAEGLIQEGEQQTKGNPRLRATHLLDQAQLCMVKGDPAGAAGYVVAAAPLIEKAREEDPHLLPVAWEILHRVCERFSDPELALIMGILAKQTAELDDRHDLVALAVDSIENVALQFPDAVARVASTLDGRSDKRQGGT